ncbi:MAG: aldo/keto reductase [Spirochaetes bacterium]|nr:aldo/keto reductase [Spirochaetota bacterium]
MSTIQLGTSKLTVSRIAYGCMPLGGSWDDAPVTDDIRTRAFTALDTAYEAGMRFFDHADIYCRGKSETVFGQWMKERKIDRKGIHIQTKCGIQPGSAAMPTRFNFSREWIFSSVDGSLARLGTDYLDVLLLHRPDVLAEPDEIAEAFMRLKQTGKVRNFGVSNHSAAQIELLTTKVPIPFVANQIELSLLHTAPLDDGVNWNISGNAHLTGGGWTVEYCRKHEITIQPWSPLAKGLLGGREIRQDDPRAAHIESTAQIVRSMAADKGVQPETILIAWLLKHPAKFQPVIGTRDPDRIRACVAAIDTPISRDEWYTLYQAGRGSKLP